MEAGVDRCVLWLRAGVVGLVALLLGIAGHVSADGLLPGVPTLVAVLALTTVLGVPVLARPASRLRLVLTVVAGQTFIHLALSLTAGHAGEPSPLAALTAVRRPPVPDPSVPVPVVVDGHRVGQLQDAYPQLADAHTGVPSLPVGHVLGHLVGDLSAHAPMMAAHLVAAALVGLWLAQGERHLWTLVALLGRRLVLAARTLHAVPPVPAPTSWRAAADARPAGPRSAHLVAPGGRRGPPVAVV